jgi:hypothetical protein
MRARWHVGPRACRHRGADDDGRNAHAFDQAHHIRRRLLQFPFLRARRAVLDLREQIDALIGTQAQRHREPFQHFI